MKNSPQKAAALTVIECLVAISPFILYFVLLKKIPDRIAAHSNAHGVVDRWAYKVSFDAFLQCIFGFFGLIMGKLLKTLIVSINPKKNQKNASKMMKATEFFMVLLFSAISFYCVVTMTGRTNFSGMFILRIAAAGLSLLWIALGYMMPGLKRNDISGIRMASVLQNNTLWHRIQKFGGHVLMAYGIIGTILPVCTFLSDFMAVILDTILFAAAIVVIFIFSAVHSAKSKYPEI